MRLKHPVLISAVLVLFLSGSLGAQEPADRIEAEAEKATMAARKKLAENIKELKFNQIEARDAVEYFRQAFGFNVYVNWKMLNAVGIDKSRPVTAKLKNVTVERALRVVLDEMGPAGSCLDYIIDDGVLVISTRDDLSRRVVTLIYPAADLLCRTRRSFTRSEGIPWRETRFIPPGEDDSFAWGDDDDDDDDDSSWGGGEPAPPEEAAEELVDLIRSMISPDTWRENAGDIGSCRVLGTNLIITQTHKNQERVQKFLTMLRAARAEQKVQIGLAIVRLDNIDSLKALRKAAASKDLQAKLTGGIDKGLWRLDRCKIEQIVLGEVVRATDLYRRVVRSAKIGEGEAAIILDYTTLTGYEIGVLPKWRKDGRLSVSVACGSGWVAKADDPKKDTPEVNVGSYRRHNIFDFTLQPGQAKVLSAVPLDARDGGVKIIVWMPKQAK
ncbi:MAG: STN domain-containing protein [Phycisphaerae bacterium]|nr:STN domain-containing protein [Phycisphaerae bacterium]